MEKRFLKDRLPWLTLFAAFLVVSMLWIDAGLVAADVKVPSMADITYYTLPKPKGNVVTTISIADGGGSISGHVYKADGVTPISGANVSAYSNSGYGSATTSFDGSYIITSLMTDNYTVVVSATGYIYEYYKDSYNSATPVAVTPPNGTANIDFTLDAGGTISGHVYKADGVTPIAGVRVYALNGAESFAIPVEGRDSLSGAGFASILGPPLPVPISPPPLHYATTAIDGSYIITSLRTDNYSVAVPLSDHLVEYYKDSYARSSANTIAVTAPNNIPNIDFTLDVGSISGHVYQSDGLTPVAGVHVIATSNSGRGSTITSSDGSYTISTLMTGNYTVFASASGYINEYYKNSYDSTSATPVAVTAPIDTPNINFTLVKAPLITSISPSVGPTIGGTSVTITGTNFNGGATVTIGGTVATGVTFVDSTSIICNTPAGTAGAQDIVVTNPDTQTSTLTGGFTYEEIVPPVPELPAGILLGAGIAGIAIYGLIRRKQIVREYGTIN